MGLPEVYASIAALYYLSSYKIKQNIIKMQRAAASKWNIHTGP